MKNSARAMLINFANIKMTQLALGRIDTHDQLSYEFGTASEVEAESVGDYEILGFLNIIAVDCKEGHFVGSTRRHNIYHHVHGPVPL